MALTFFGSGLGWLGLAIGRTAVDLWVPEAIPFFSALSNAHFPLAAAALLVAVTAFSATPLRRGVRFLAAGGSGLLLGAVQPFAVLPAVLVGAVWGVWTTVRPPKDAAPSEVRRDQLVSGLVFLATSVPWLLYDLWVTRTYSALAAWSAQNLTPTPPAQDVFLGFGLVFALSVASLWIARPADSLGGRMLLTWLSVGLVLVFVPFGLQRRMMLGAFFPMAGLAGLVLSRLADAGGGRKLLAVALFLLCLPSNLVVLTASLGGTLGQQPEVVLTEPEIKAYRWMEDRVPPGSLVLAGEVSGNRLPAFTDSRVVYGHPFETPDAALTLAWVDSTFTDVDPEASLARLREMSIDYVFVGPRERSLGPLTWLSALQSVYEADGVAVYRVGAP
jgi:hypothetical protein